MNIELLEIRDFLVAHPPFDLLPDDTLEQLPTLFRIRYLRRGQAFPPAGAEPTLYLVRQGAIELRNTQGILIEKLAEGELYSAVCDPPSDIPQHIGTTSEDTLLYCLSCSQFQQLCQAHADFAGHFTASLRQQLQRILNALQKVSVQPTTLLDMKVYQVLAREPVTASPDISIVDAARRMTNEGLSSLLLVESGKLCGLITDKDLRSRCVAEQRDMTQPVRTIMTTQLKTIDHHAQCADALLLMNQHNLHHLPVMHNDKLLGMISSTDLIRQQSNDPLLLVRRMHRAQTIEELVDASRMIPDLQIQLLNSHTTCYRLGQILSSVVDALTQRLIMLAQSEHGEAPINYAWLASGSLARQEMTSLSDQDNALLLSDDYHEAEHGDYFSQLARFICDGLAACGIAYCPGEIMAINPQWRQPLNTWQNYFTDWIRHPSDKSVMLACNFYDLRVIAGDSGLFEQLFPAAVELAQNNQIFLAHLAANATHHPVPLGFFRQFVLHNDNEHSDSLDLKHGGIIPLTELARLFALEAGVTSINSYKRLQQASEKHGISQAGATDLQDALDIINTLRLRHQAQCHAQGLAIDNFINPKHLSHIERQSLKQAFTIIRDMHTLLAQRYQTERFLT